jgi:hypothetical protein
VARRASGSRNAGSRAPAKLIGFRAVLDLPGVSILATSRGASKLASAVISYGAMVYLATQGASQLQVSVVAASTYAPPP